MADSTHKTAGSQRNQSMAFLLITGGIFVALNIIGIFLFKRVDVTRNHAFTLSEGSKRLVRTLEDDLNVTAYFTDNLPPPHNATVRYVRDILAEYAASSNGKLRVRFVSPDTDDEKHEAEERGVQRTINQALQDNAVQAVEGYRGLVFEYHGERRSIPVVQSTEGLEYLITMEIKQLVGQKLDIGILSGHEGPTLAAGLTTFSRMLPHYNLREIPATSEIPQTIKALLIIDPQTAFSEDELRYINQYVMRGGSLGVFGGVMKVNLQSEDATATPANTGLNRLLEAWGVRFQNNIIADAQCRQQPMNRSVDTPFGPMQAQVPVPHPPFIVAQVDEAVRENPVVYRLPEVNAFFASSLETTEVFAANHGVILFKSSDNGWALTGDSISLRIREPHDWETTQQNRFQAYNLGASVSGSLRNAFSAPVSTAPATPSPIEAPETATNARVVVMGTSLFLRDELYGQRPPAANQIAALMGIALNTVDYLVQDSDLIAVRAKSVDEPELRVPQTVQRAEAQAMAAAEQGERDEAVAAIQRGRSELEKWNGRKKFIQWLNTLGVPLLFAAIAFGYALMRKSKQAALRA